MFGHDYYHESIRKYIILFGTLFNDIHIKRKNSSGNVIQKIKCPLTYAPREKVTARLEQNLNLTEQQSILLPRLSFEMTTLQYDPARKLNTINKRRKDATDPALRKSVFNPVPYDISFDFNIYVRYAEDATQILEQILPFFTPEYTATINLIPEMDIKADIPIVLQGMSSQDTYEGDFETRRALIWNLNFIMKGYLYGPIKETSIINNANINFYTSSTANLIATSTKLTPGLDEFRNPTTNAAATLPPSEIKSGDNFDYIFNYEDYFNGDIE